MPGKKSDSVKRSRKFRSLLLLDDKVPERFPVQAGRVYWVVFDFWTRMNR